MLNYNNVMKKLSLEEFQNKKKEFEISLNQLNIKEVAHLLNDMDASLLTNRDFANIHSTIECLKYLSDKSSIYKAAKTNLEEKKELLGLSKEDIDFLQNKFPTILSKNKEIHTDNLYLEKSNYKLWKNLSHDHLVKQINKGMIDFNLLDDINKDYMKNLRVQAGAYDFSEKIMRNNKHYLKNLMKWFPDENLSLDKALQMVEYDREAYLYLPENLQLEPSIFVKIFNNTHHSYDAIGETFDKDEKNWKITDFENKILKKITDHNKLGEIVGALLNFDENFAKSKYINHLAKTHVAINTLLSELKDKKEAKIFNVNNVPEQINSEDLHLQSKEVLKKYLLTTSTHNKENVFPFLIEHFSYKDLENEEGFEESKHSILKSCLNMIMSYGGNNSSKKKLVNLVSFTQNLLQDNDEIVLALITLNKELDIYNDEERMKVLRKEIEKTSNVDVQLKFLKDFNKHQYKISEEMRKLIDSYEKAPKKKNRVKIK